MSASSGGRPPNVLVIMTDQQHAGAVGVGEHHTVATPNLADLASGGMQFERAYFPHPLCVPSRVSFWTGVYPHDHGARTNERRLDSRYPNVAGQLHEAGSPSASPWRSRGGGPPPTPLGHLWDARRPAARQRTGTASGSPVGSA